MYSKSQAAACTKPVKSSGWVADRVAHAYSSATAGDIALTLRCPSFEKKVSQPVRQAAAAAAAVFKSCWLSGRLSQAKLAS